MPYSCINSGKIYYQATTGQCPVIVFVHGAGGSSQRWAEQLAALSGTYRTIAVDLPGHGKSEGELLSTIDDFAEFMGEFVRSLGVEQFVLTGHSMGGAVAQEFALRYPEKVLGLILVATGARLRVNPQTLTAFANGERPFTNANHLYGVDVPASMLEDAYVELQEVSTEIYLRDFQACDKFDRTAEIPSITVPTQIIVGDNDIMTPLKYSQFLHAHIAKSSLSVISGAGHMCMQEKPEEVTAVICKFLAGLKA